MCPSSMNSSPNAHLKIRSRKDYLMYTEADRVALGRKRTVARFLFDGRARGGNIKPEKLVGLDRVGEGNENRTCHPADMGKQN